MNKNKIEDFDFVDCLLIDFEVDKLLSSLFVIIEAYYPSLPNGKRKKGLLKVTFDKIRHSSITKGEEFDFDIQLKYDKGGNDSKANEIYSIDIFDMENKFIRCVLESDMLNFDLECRKIELEELS